MSTYFGIGDICSHDDGPLGDGNLEGFHVICPRHGGGFDVQTGSRVNACGGGYPCVSCKGDGWDDPGWDCRRNE